MIPKAVYFLLLLCVPGTVVLAQERFYTKTGKISFLSNAPLEDIEAVNKTAGAILSSKTGSLQFVVLMKGFEFKKALMQEHFNENYVESHKYPKAEFRGTLVNNATVNYAKDGTYSLQASGQLNFHGVEKDITAPVTLKLLGGRIEAVSSFTILLSDYRISIPSLVKDKISNKVKVTVDVKLEPLKM